MPTLVAAGTSGFLGNRLVAAAADHGFTVVRLVRRAPSSSSEVRWDPDSGSLDRSVLDGADAVVNLCGVPLNHRFWTDDYKALIRTSRVRPTKLLASAAAEAGVPTLLNASAVGFYGPHGDEVVDETAPAGATFTAGVCADWEAATADAGRGGVRVVNLRTGLVLGATGGLLPVVKTVTQGFLGGRLGSGRQYFPWISVTDWVDAVFFLLKHPEVSGPVNLTGPEPVTNAEFTKVLGKALHRPAPWMVPEFAVKLALGEFAGEVLTGQRAVPGKLSDAGFVFSHATLPEALRAELR
jgi:uncharacterized protein (TIGR01777 family)